MISENTVSTQFQDVRETLKTMADENSKIVIDYETPAGQKQARSQIFRFRSLNGAIDKRHKEIKADYLEKTKMIDAVRRELRQIVADMIEVHDAPLREIEARETRRVEAINAQFTRLNQIVDSIKFDSKKADIVVALDALLAIEISKEVFQERHAEATKLFVDSVDRIESWAREAMRREELQAEADRLRKQAEEQARIDRERQIAEEAALRATQIAEAAASKREAALERKIEEITQSFTTIEEDRDGDVLHATDAKLDTPMPLLWQHDPLPTNIKSTVDRLRSGRLRSCASGLLSFCDEMIESEHECVKRTCDHESSRDCCKAMVEEYLKSIN